jgi:hypothetical protein
VPDPPWKRRSIRAVASLAGAYPPMPGMPTAGPTRKCHGVTVAGERLSLSRVAHVCPAVQPGRASCGNPHVNHTTLAPDQIDAMPYNEKLSLTTTLITKLLTNPLAQSRLTADSGCQSPASGLDHLTGRLSMAWKTSGSSLLSPTCLGGYRIFGRSMHRTIEVCCHPGAGGSHCSIPHLKPDNQLLINSQAVYRPSLVENSRVTMSSVEQ